MNHRSDRSDIINRVGEMEEDNEGEKGLRGDDLEVKDLELDDELRIQEKKLIADKDCEDPNAKVRVENEDEFSTDSNADTKGEEEERSSTFDDVDLMAHLSHNNSGKGTESKEKSPLIYGQGHPLTSNVPPTPTSTGRSQSNTRGGMNQQKWKRTVPPATPSVSDLGSTSSRGGDSASSRRSASFTPETTFAQKTGRSRVPKRKSKEKIIDHINKTVVKIILKIHPSPNNQTMVMKCFGDLLDILHKKDDAVAIVNHSTNVEMAFNRSQLPGDLDDFKEDWVKFDCNNKVFINKVPAGKTRQIKGSMLIASNWDMKKLIERTELSLSNIGFTLSYKELQYVETKHDLHITGCVNSLYLPAAAAEVKAILREAAFEMSLHPDKYSPIIYGEDRIAEFCLIKEYAENGPWVTRDKDEKVPNWQKMMMSVEYKEEDEEELIKRMDYARNRGMFKKVFGQFTGIFKNPGSSCSLAERKTWGDIISRHGSINLSMGSVLLNGLVDADVRYGLEFLPDEEGNAKPPVRRSVREILMGVKVGGVRLLQVVMATETGIYEAHYPNGKGCIPHQTAAREWGSMTAAHLRYHVQKRGVTEDSAFGLLNAAFSAEAVLQAETATLNSHGKVINQRQRRMESEIAAIDACSWVDSKAGLCKSELVEMMGVQEKESVIDPTSMAAFNFEKYGAHDDMTVNKDKTKVEDASTVSNLREGTSLATNTMYEPDLEDQTTIADGDGGNTVMPELADWEMEGETESTTTAEREEDKIDAQLMTARKEEVRHQEKKGQIIGDIASLKRTESEETLLQAFDTPASATSFTTQCGDDTVTIPLVMAQIEMLRKKLQGMQAKTPPPKAAQPKSAHAARRPKTPPPLTFPFDTDKPGKAATGKKEANTADLASGPPTSNQDEAKKPVANSASKSKSNARVVVPGHQNG